MVHKKSARRTIVVLSTIGVVLIVQTVLLLEYLSKGDTPVLVAIRPVASESAQPENAVEATSTSRLELVTTEQPAHTVMTIAVHVRGELNVPVAGASVSWCNTADPPNPTQSDEKGTAILASRAAVSWLRVEMRQYATSVLQITPETTEATVVLKRAARIEGNVETAFGSPPSARMHVVAFRCDEPEPEASDMVGGLKRRSFIAKTESDVNGHFVLEGLSENENYLVVAGGHGLAAKQSIRMQSNSSNNKVVVYQVHVARVNFNLSDGRPAPLFVKNRPRPSMFAFWLGDKNGVCKMGHAHQGLLLAAEGLDLSDGDGVYYAVAQSDRYGQRLDPAYFQCELHGHRKVDGTIYLDPLSQHVATFEFKAVPITTCFGGLTVSFGLAEPGGSSKALGRPDGTLTLYLMDQKASPIILDIDGSDSLNQDFDGIPCGTYQARYVASASGWTYPQSDKPLLPISISGGRAEVKINIDDLGGVLLEDESSVVPWATKGLDVTVVRGSVDLSSADGASYSGKSLDVKPPYRLLGLPAGSYTIIKNPGGNLPVLPVECHVDAGQMSKVRWTR